MYANDGDKIRAFPFRPTAESSGLTDYIELSGCNGLLIEAVKKLYEVANKPENPIEWLRLYFKYLAEDVAAGAAPGVLAGGTGDADSDFTRDPEEVEQMLKVELAEIESEIISCFEEETQNKAVLEKMDNELKRVTLSSARNHYHDDFLMYLEKGEDYHYRIRPDPLYKPSKTDMLLEKEDNDNRAELGAHGQGGGFGGGAPLKQEDSMVELVSFNPNLWSGDGILQQSGIYVNLKRDEKNKIYGDYPKLYFPDRQREEILEEEEEDEDEDDETEEEEEKEEEGADETVSGSEGGATLSGGKDLKNSRSSRTKKKSRNGGLGASSEYDGGSEGGESDQYKPRTKQSDYTPRSAHDRKHKDKSQKNRSKQTSDKNV